MTKQTPIAIGPSPPGKFYFQTISLDDVSNIHGSARAVSIAWQLYRYEMFVLKTDALMSAEKGLERLRRARIELVRAEGAVQSSIDNPGIP